MPLTLPPVTGETSLVIFASDCHFATAVVEILVQAGITISAIVLPGPPTLDSPMHARPPGGPLVMASLGRVSLETLAGRLQVPVYRGGRLDTAAWHDLLTSIAPDLLLSVCYPRLIPAGIVEAVNNAAVNVHPSLLPDLRGPDPLFWTFRRATGESGLTLHLINERFDAGPIVAQQAVTFEPGTREPELEQMHARSTVELLIRSLPAVTSNNQFDIDQDDALATWAPNPAAGDYVIDRTWTAEQAFTFIRGIEDRGYPVTIGGGDTPVNIRIRRAHAFVQSRHELEDSGRGIAVELSDGYLIADIVPEHAD